MIDRFNRAIEIAEKQFIKAGYRLLYDHDYCARFISNTEWYIDVQGAPTESCAQLKIGLQNKNYEMSFYVWLLMDVFEAMHGLKIYNKKYETQLEFVVDNADLLFKTPPDYLAKYDELNQEGCDF